MSEHINWDDLERELGVTEWRAQHPWLYRRLRFRMWLRQVVWNLSRIDIG